MRWRDSTVMIWPVVASAGISLRITFATIGSPLRWRRSACAIAWRHAGPWQSHSSRSFPQ